MSDILFFRCGNLSSCVSYLIVQVDMLILFVDLFPFTTFSHFFLLDYYNIE